MLFGYKHWFLKKRGRRAVDSGRFPKSVEVRAEEKGTKGGMKAREMEERDGTREEMETLGVCVKRLYSSLWSPKVSPAAAHGERLD